MHDIEPRENRILARIQAGMKVIDASGNEVGTVDHVKMGQPDAATTQGNEPQPGPFGGLIHAVLGERPDPDVPEPFRSRLLRSGYVKVDGPGLAGVDRYVSPDQVAGVDDDGVLLAVSQGDLVQER